MERRISKMFVVLLFTYVILTSMGLVLFKLGTTGNTFDLALFGHTITLSWKMIIGIMFYGISFLLWLYIVSKNDLTYIFPIQVALVNLFVVVESIIFLNEKISLVQGIGILVVIFGVIMVKWGTN